VPRGQHRHNLVTLSFNLPREPGSALRSRRALALVFRHGGMRTGPAIVLGAGAARAGPLVRFPRGGLPAAFNGLSPRRSIPIRLVLC
jgi:hypothetical protein